MNDKHAYMIMAHHRPDLLQLLIDALDDERNDIIIHIDKKGDMPECLFKTKHARLFFTKRIDVHWGGYSQVECEYLLLENALEKGEHQYYHFLTGANFPLYCQNTIHEFFSKMHGYEFVGFDNGANFYDRTRFYVPFSEFGKLSGIRGKMVLGIRKVAESIQRLLRIDRNKKYSLEIKKGLAYFSITEEFAKYLLEKRKIVEDMLKHTICCDEVFVQTIIFNSRFRQKVYNLDNEFEGSMRECAWPSNIPGVHKGWNYSLKDLDYLLSSKRMFAMKFESEDGIEVINKIKQTRNI